MLLFPIKAGMHVGNYRPGNVTIPTYMQINVCKFNIRGSALCNNSFWGEGRRGEGGGAVAIYFAFTAVGSIQYLSSVLQ